jgi:lysophospholipase L1-like esterase
MWRSTWLVLVVSVIPCWARFACGDEPAKPPAADRWEPAIKAFEEQDRKSPPASGANVFVGSSSIRMWKLDASFPKHVCLNRGFGGSEMVDSAHYVERIVIAYKPRVVVVYAGDNDLSLGKSPETVLADYRTFRDKVRAALPETKIVFVSIKPSPSRWKLHEKYVEANRLIRAEIENGRQQVFVDVWMPMLGDDGMPRAELFLKDRLHMNETGYAIWNKLIEPHLVTSSSH